MAACTLDEAYECAFGGKLTWKGALEGRRAYDALLVDADELTRLVRDKPQRKCLTRKEFKQAVPGLAENTPQFLVDEGAVTETEEYSPDARRMIPVIPHESADAVKARYVALGELLDTYGLHHKQALPILVRDGVEPAFDRKKAGCFIFERLAAEKALQSRP